MKSYFLTALVVVALVLTVGSFVGQAVSHVFGQVAAAMSVAK